MKPSSSVPKFLTKIWSLVEDPKTNHYICWSQCCRCGNNHKNMCSEMDGNSFVVVNEERFAKELLPRHFKHNNMASFVRQLNWYGFHKVLHDESSAMRQDKYCSGKYQHEFFKRGQEELLTKIKRKVPVPRIDENKSAPDDMHKILAFLHQLQGRQDITDSTVESLKRENEALWKEVIHLRQKQYQSQPQFEPVSPSQSYDRMANTESNQTLMIDSTGNYNEFAVPKESKSIDQDYDNRSQWTVNGKETRGTKRAFSPKGEQMESSTEEASETFTSITLPQMFETYQPDDYDNPTDSSSSDSNEDTFHDPSHSSMNISGQPQGTNKRFKISLEEHDFETDYKMEYSGSEDADEHKNHYGHAKKMRKSCASAKMERMLKHMHRENVCLTKRVLALEQQSFKKLSEISTVLSTLAGYVMNTQNFPKPFLSSLTADEKRVQPKES